MWALAKGEDFLPEVTLYKLKRLYKQEKKTKPKLRLLCAMHRKEGKTIDAIVGAMRLPRRTVHGWLQRFEERGVTAKDSIKQSGRPPVLSRKQMRQLITDLERGPPNNKSGLWSTKEVRNLIRKKYRVKFVSQHVYRILISLGFSIQRPRKRHYKRASDAEIKRFKKKHDDSTDDTERKALSWAQKTKQASA